MGSIHRSNIALVTLHTSVFILIPCEMLPLRKASSETNRKYSMLFFICSFDYLFTFKNNYIQTPVLPLIMQLIFMSNLFFKWMRLLRTSNFWINFIVEQMRISPSNTHTEREIYILHKISIPNYLIYSDVNVYRGTSFEWWIVYSEFAVMVVSTDCERNEKHIYDFTYIFFFRFQFYNLLFCSLLFFWNSRSKCFGAASQTTTIHFNVVGNIFLHVYYFVQLYPRFSIFSISLFPYYDCYFLFLVQIKAKRVCMHHIFNHPVVCRCVFV